MGCLIVLAVLCIIAAVIYVGFWLLIGAIILSAKLFVIMAWIGIALILGGLISKLGNK